MQTSQKKAGNLKETCTKGMKKQFTEEEAQMVKWYQKGHSSSLVIGTTQTTSDTLECHNQKAGECQVFTRTWGWWELFDYWEKSKEYDHFRKQSDNLSEIKVKTS